MLPHIRYESLAYQRVTAQNPQWVKTYLWDINSINIYPVYVIGRRVHFWVNTVSNRAYRPAPLQGHLGDEPSIVWRVHIKSALVLIWVSVLSRGKHLRIGTMMWIRQDYGSKSPGVRRLRRSQFLELPLNKTRQWVYRGSCLHCPAFVVVIAHVPCVQWALGNDESRCLLCGVEPQRLDPRRGALESLRILVVHRWNTRVQGKPKAHQRYRTQRQNTEQGSFDWLISCLLPPKQRREWLFGFFNTQSRH